MTSYRKKCKNDINITGIDEINNIIYDYKAQIEHEEKYRKVLWEIKNCVGSIYNSSNRNYCIYTPYMKLNFEFCKDCGEMKTDPDITVSKNFGCKCWIGNPNELTILRFFS